MAFISSLDSTNEVDTATIQVSVVGIPVSTVSSYDNTANLSDVTVYDFLANQPNGSRLVHEELEQIHEDDLEKMDLKWQLALLSMRARRFKIMLGIMHFYNLVLLIQLNAGVPRTTANADGTSTSTIPGLVTTEEKAQKKNDVKARSMLLMALPNEHLLTFSQYKDAKTLFKAIQESTNEIDTANIQVSIVSAPVSTVNTHDNTANLSDATVYAFLANQPNGSQLVYEDLEQIYEDDLEEMDLKWQLALLSYDWSYMADDEVLTNMALMALSDSEVQNRKTYSNTCLKTYETLKTQYDNLRIEFNKSEFDLATYKRGLASVEEQIVFYKKNEVMLCDQIVVLKRDASFRDSEIIALNLQIEKLKKEKESNEIKIDNFENTSKSLDKLIGSQITNNSKTWLGFTSYNAVAPLPTGYRPKDSKSVCIDTSNEIKKASDALINKDWVSDSDEDESEEMVLKSDNVQHKPKQANQPRKVRQNPRNN
nr:hypothetical protein [Tanacetum cinerariifolium]